MITKVTKSLNILARPCVLDDYYDDTQACFIQFDREILGILLEIREKLESDEFKRLGISSVDISGPYCTFLKDIPEELENLVTDLDNGEYVYISSDPEELDYTEESIDCEECRVSSYGVLISGQIKHTSVRVESPYFSWEEIEDLYKRPKSIDYVDKIRGGDK